MTYQQAIKQLKACGTAQNRKVYGRHGIADAMFGVSFADLKALAKKIKVDHDLAVRLWESNNHDARVLATMIADPAKLTARQLDDWARSLGNYVITDALAGLVAKTRYANAKADKWGKSRNDHIGQLGWNLVTHLSMQDAECPDEYLADKIGLIEGQIHRRKNRTRHAMNMALCGIGIGRASLRRRALAAAERIGKVVVDHGQTSCKTPDAADYIKRAAARKPAKTSTRKTKA